MKPKKILPIRVTRDNLVQGKEYLIRLDYKFLIKYVLAKFLQRNGVINVFQLKSGARTSFYDNQFLYDADCVRMVGD